MHGWIKRSESTFIHESSPPHSLSVGVKQNEDDAIDDTSNDDCCRRRRRVY